MGGFGFRDARASALNDGGETASQFTNAIGAVKEHGLAGDELLADAEGRGASQQIMCGILLSDSAAGNKPNVGKGAAESADVVIAADERTGKDFDEVRTGFPGVEDFCRCEGASHHDDFGIFGDHFDSGDVESGATDELSARIDAGLRGLDIHDGSGADDDVREATYDFADDVDGTGNGHGDFDDGDAAMSDLGDGETSVFGRRSADDGNDSDFLDARAKGLFRHGGGALLKWPLRENTDRSVECIIVPVRGISRGERIESVARSEVIKSMGTERGYGKKESKVG